MAARARKKAPPTSARVPVLEWAAAVLGGLMAITLLALVLIDARRQHEPPVLVVEPLEVAQTTGGWRVLFEVRNEGGETAGQVQVVGALANGEEAHAVIDDVPGRSSAKGGLFFKGDPRAGRMNLRAEGFVEP